MGFEHLGGRRAFLKASVAMAAMTGAAGMLGACTPDGGAGSDAAKPLVETNHGLVRGTVEDGVSVFKGVRYGADTATTRFAAPNPAAPWTGVLDAVAYGNSAPQPASGDGGGMFASWRPDPPIAATEDCLFLNVWTPEANANKKRPVLVWFHGGGFTTGSGSSYAYDGVRLAKRGDVVVVTTNHRLNLFGYLNLTQFGERFADSPSVGVLDMILSLEWVRDNIAAFGGDPENVLIFGESGGGSKVCTLMSTDRAKGLFHRAVVQSGPRITHPPAEAAQAAAATVVEKLGLTADTIGQILTKSVEEIQSAAAGVALAGSGPTLDGRTLVVQPFDPAAAPAGASVPLLIGCNRTEGTSLTPADSPNHNLTWETLPVALQDAFPGRDVAKVLELYRTNHPNIEAAELYFMAVSDNGFFRGSVTVADRKAQQDGAPVWFYMLDWVTPVLGGKRYVPHALDIGMVFDNVAKSESMSGPAGPEPQAIADQMSESWLAFARTGDPNNAAVPTWPAYTAGQRNMMVFRAQPGVEVDIRADERAATAAPAT